MIQPIEKREANFTEWVLGVSAVFVKCIISRKPPSCPFPPLSPFADEEAELVGVNLLKVFQYLNSEMRWEENTPCHSQSD